MRSSRFSTMSWKTISQSLNPGGAVLINADLVTIYEVSDIKQDSQYALPLSQRTARWSFGMGAFLKFTADSLGTSPIHRATFVMENPMGIHPTPPPADVKIEEPDIRAARTMKDVLISPIGTERAHVRNIDPYGWHLRTLICRHGVTHTKTRRKRPQKHNRHDGP